MGAGAAAGAQIGLQLITSGLQYGRGVKQAKEAKKLRSSLSDPHYEIPNSIEDNLMLAKSMANEGISAEEESQALDAINNNAANSISRFRDRKGRLLGAEVVGEQVRQSNADLRLLDIKQKLENQKLFMKQNQIYANYQDKAFDINVISPFERNFNRAASLESASIQNKNNAINSFAQSANTGISSYISTL